MKDLFERQIKSEIQSQKSRAEDSGFAGHCKSMCQKCVRNADPDMDPDMETVKCQAELAAGLVPGKVKSDPGQRAAGLVLEAMREPDAAGGGLKPGAATGLVPDVGVGRTRQAGSSPTACRSTCLPVTPRKCRRTVVSWQAEALRKIPKLP